jgi:hypothetical protein
LEAKTNYRNTKFEIQSTKQIQMTQIQNKLNKFQAVIPAKAGIQVLLSGSHALAGMVSGPRLSLG